MNELSVVPIINCGSSSIKFSVPNASDYEVLMSGIADGINSKDVFLSVSGRESVPLAHHSYEGVLKVIAFELEKRNLNDNVVLISHRIAHGDSIFTGSVIITDEIIGNIRRVSPLAPLHDYANLSGIESAQQLLPGVTQVAVLGISFHQTMAPGAYLYSLPWKYYEELGVRCYGLHGTSHRYVSQHMHPLLNLAEGDFGLVVAYLGNGVLICTVHNGQGVDTSMGMTPLEDLMTGTRSGDVDSGVTSWVVSQTNQSLGDLEHMVSKESGLLGISGLSSDLRVLERVWYEDHERTQLVIRTLVHRTTRHIIGCAIPLYRPSGIMFIGGMRESSSLIRCLVAEHLAVLGVEISTETNSRSNSLKERIVSSENARVIYAVILINEEKIIALDAIRSGKVNAPAESA